MNRKDLDLQLANQLLQLSNLIKEASDSLIVSNPCLIKVSDDFSFDLVRLVDVQSTTFELSLYDEKHSRHTYLIWLTFGVDFVEVELRRYKKSEGVFIELYTARGGLLAPSLTTLKALVSNIHTTSAVSLFSEGLRQLGFEE